jgi:uncharacterized protein (UPF0332 family)
MILRVLHSRMSVKSRDIFQHAKSMLNPENCSEIQSRLLINRAYYGVYGSILNEVENRLFYEIDESNPSVHQRLINVFKDVRFTDSNKSKLAAQISTKLRQLKLMRTKADYNLDDNIHFNDASLAIAIGEQLLELVENLD